MTPWTSKTPFLSCEHREMAPHQLFLQNSYNWIHLRTYISKLPKIASEWDSTGITATVREKGASALDRESKDHYSSSLFFLLKWHCEVWIAIWDLLGLLQSSQRLHLCLCPSSYTHAHSETRRSREEFVHDSKIFTMECVIQGIVII